MNLPMNTALVDQLVQDVRRTLPNLTVIQERTPSPSWQATAYRLKCPFGGHSDIVLIAEPDGLMVHFGHGLVLESDANDESSAARAAAEAKALLDLITRHGFVEKLWKRGDQVVSAEAHVVLLGSRRRLRTRGPRPLWRSQVQDVTHPPWTSARENDDLR